MVYLSLAVLALTASTSSAFAPPTPFGSQALGTAAQLQTLSHPHQIRQPQPLFATHKISVADFNNISDHPQASDKNDVVREIEDRARAVEAQTAALREAIEEEQVNMQKWTAQRMQQTLPPIRLDIERPEVFASGGDPGAGAAIASRPGARSATISLLVGGGAVAAAGGPAVASSPEVIQQWPVGLAAFAALPFLAFNGDSVVVDTMTNMRYDFGIGPQGGNVRTLASVLPSNYVEINRFEQGIVQAKEIRAAEMEPSLKDLDVASSTSVTIASAAAVADSNSSVGGLGRIVSGATVVAAAAAATTKREAMIDATTRGTSVEEPKRKRGDISGMGGYFDLAADLFDEMTGNLQESAKELKAKNYLKLAKNAEGALAAEATTLQIEKIETSKPVEVEVPTETEVATVNAIEIEPEVAEAVVKVTEDAEISTEQQPTTVTIIEHKSRESNSIQQLHAHLSTFMSLFHKHQVRVRSALFCDVRNNRKMQEQEAIKIQSHLSELASLHQYPSVRVKSPLFYVGNEDASIGNKNESKSWIRVQLSKFAKLIFGATRTAYA